MLYVRQLSYPLLSGDLWGERYGTTVALSGLFMLNYIFENLIIIHGGSVVYLIILISFFADTEFF